MRDEPTTTPEQPTEYRQYRFRLPPGAADLIIVRHGESLPTREGVPIPMRDGHADPPLDPRGHLEAERVAERLTDEDVTAIYVSTLQRTHQTAAPLAARLGIEPQVEADLREVHLGDWEGPEFRRHMAGQHPLARRIFEEERWDVIPGAETMDALRERVRGAIGRIAAANPDRRTVVVAHGGVIGMIVAIATGGRPFAFVTADNASLTHLVVTPEHWILRRFNDTGHLGTDLDRPPEPLT